MLYTVLTFDIFGQSYAHLIIAKECQTFHNIKFQLVDKLFDPNSLFCSVSQSNVLSFSCQCRHCSLFLTAQQYYRSIEEKIVAHYQLLVLWISGKVAICIASQSKRWRVLR